MTTQMSGERSQLAALPLEDKVRLLTGADSWRIPGCDALGLRPMVTSDGPSGVRGTTLDESNPSSCLPCRSEERRVGKECTSRWSRSDRKDVIESETVP